MKKMDYAIGLEAGRAGQRWTASALTDRAKERTPERVTFLGRPEALRFLKESQTEGYRFSGAELVDPEQRLVKNRYFVIGGDGQLTLSGEDNGPRDTVWEVGDVMPGRDRSMGTEAVNDRLTTDTYDNDGNTISSGGTASTYDFENRMLTHGGVSMVYDGDGNRVSETTGGVTTNYLVDTLNPSGYSQVMDEVVGGAVTRTYAYGLQRISENQLVGSTWTPSFYGYDGHGNVRFLTSSTGTVGNTYQFDAFGMPVANTGTTANTYLYSGERFDSALSLYHLRARYYNPLTGRFMTMDHGRARHAAGLGLVFHHGRMHIYMAMTTQLIVSTRQDNPRGSTRQLFRVTRSRLLLELRKLGYASSCT